MQELIRSCNAVEKTVGRRDKSWGERGGRLNGIVSRDYYPLLRTVPVARRPSGIAKFDEMFAAT